MNKYIKMALFAGVGIIVLKTVFWSDSPDVFYREPGHEIDNNWLPSNLDYWHNNVFQEVLIELTNQQLESKSIRRQWFGGKKDVSVTYAPSIERTKQGVRLRIKARVERHENNFSSVVDEMKFADIDWPLARVELTYFNGATEKREGKFFKNFDMTFPDGDVRGLTIFNQLFNQSWTLEWSTEFNPLTIQDSEVCYNETDDQWPEDGFDGNAIYDDPLSPWVYEIGGELNSSNTPPACCKDVQFSCKKITPATIRGYSGTQQQLTTSCTSAEKTAIKRCGLGKPYRTSYFERYFTKDDGRSKLRILVIDVAGRKLAVSIEEKEKELEVWQSAEASFDGKGHEVFNFDPASKKVSKADDDLWNVLGIIALGDGSPEGLFTRLYESKEQMGRAYLKEKLAEQKENCQHTSLIVIDDPVMANVLAGLFDNSGVPEIHQALLDTQAGWELVSDSDQPLEFRVLALGMVSLQGVSTLFRARGATRVLDSQLKQLRKRARKDAKRIKKMRKWAKDAPDEESRKVIQEQLTFLEKKQARTNSNMKSLEQMALEIKQKGVTRKIVDDLMNKSPKSLKKELRKSHEAVATIEKTLSESNLKPKKRKKLLQALAKQRATNRIYSEVLGEKGVQHAYRGAKAKPKGFSQPKRPQRHGPDDAFEEPNLAFSEENIDVLVEAKGVSGKRYRDGSPNFNDLLRARKSARPFQQHSPIHVRSFARKRVLKAKKELRNLRKCGGSAAEIAEWKQHLDYWNSIHKRSISGTNLKLELVVTNTENLKFTRFRYNYTDEVWEKVTEGKVR